MILISILSINFFKSYRIYTKQKKKKKEGKEREERRPEVGLGLPHFLSIAHWAKLKADLVQRFGSETSVTVLGFPFFQQCPLGFK